MKVVSAIGFSIYSPEQIRKMSAVKITMPDTYDEDGYPIGGGLADQRLGVVDPGLKCRTCGGRMKDCPGHPGHIEAVRPVVHVGFGKFIYQLLRFSCRKCARVMHMADSIEESKRSLECPHCGEKQRKIKFVKPTTYYEDDRRLLPNEIRERLEHIPDEDLHGLGVSIRPEWAVLTVLMVPPVTVRPSITLETGERSEDDLTHKLVDILRINQRLEENIDAGAPQLIIEDLWELLQYHVTTFFDNETAGIPPARHRSGRQLKTLFQRLKGKEGRFRYNLSGKRVNFSARTVVSPDPTLGINELGVPIDIARELTVPVSVTQWNLEAVKDMIRKNNERINYVIRPDGKRKKITPANLEEILLEVTMGYTVERQLFDGDVIIFNRQPSLHRVSMMAHTVRVLPGKTFRFNVADCAPYNADFDGDEMNVHVPQTEEAQAEAELLMKVQENILSPRNASPLVAPDLDQITGLYLLSLDDFVVSKKEACNLLNAAGGIEAEFDKNTISGKEIFSMLLPEGLNMEIKDKAGNVKIKNGKLTEGFLNTHANRDIVKTIFNEFGSDEARKYIDAATRLSVQLVYGYGFSLSLRDYHLPPEALEEVNKLYEEGKQKLEELVKKYKTRKLERLPGKTLKETLEEQVMNIVELIRFHCWNIVKDKIAMTNVDINGHTFSHNPSLLMAQAGVKNKPINVVQMAALVGQQAVRGKRPASGFKKRLLPHYRKGDLGDNARGFVKHNYTQGLNATEYFFHAAGGRDSVVDKGVNPAKTGYMQRRLINALQDFIVWEDATVRDSEGNLIQFKYGGDGIDPSTGKPIAYGEPVGVVAAQSIGEPGTQMTLRTFHYAGVASLAQFGFTRLVELVDARKSPKKPVMEIMLKKSVSGDFEKVKGIAARIEQVSLADVAHINENFERKVVTITIDPQMLKDKMVREKDILAQVELIAPNFKQDGHEISIKTKEDSLKSIRKLTLRLKELHLSGIPCIRKAIIIEKKADGGREYAIATDGSNLPEVFKLEEVDPYRTSTNDVMEIGRVLGIEAARNAIIQEINKVMEMQDLHVDDRHIMLIADGMTFLGEVSSVGRHGLAGKKKSVLARAAFEETAKHLLHACIYGEEDDLKGIAENIIIGQTIPAGTGIVKLEMKLD
ncbi:TPA: DNA-directed RNA polymerase subunit A' [Candidatus Micrarchaeota archaeon]|nr:DNA-directed RNA polymerase subunit A' [Candidatus Micrarchaeota archaeon]